ncbi:hypothetical protein [Paenibacillus sp. FSL R7-0331]|uniref:hypothetical protein n=1 Tax=Paenibacillus sp. FSL R7-0331 TaxID=1536773 RepID=UPI0004F682F1|nr:hypothetical protein [Paenibacillus sp. FSL R7-0331]AIQ53464.1 hypothetical protein R70331_19310 [Paenibacillus sp. FSL R7-0331]
MTITLAATVFSILITIVILFQAALAAGMPWGEYAMGGKFPGRLPVPLRVACLIQIVILALLALIVLSKAEMLLPSWRELADVTVWFVVAFSVIASVLNLITKSVRERRIWAPVSIVMLISSLIVTLG